VGDPGRVYAERLAARREVLARAERRHRIAEWARGATALAVVAVIVFAAESSTDPRWLFAPLAAFAASGALLVGSGRRRARARRAVAHYEAGLERLRGSWWSDGTGAEFAPDAHPYAHDLDVIGERSLFARLDTTCTRAGAAKLADWLLTPAPPDELRRRQAAVRELREDLDLREELAVAAGDRIGHGDPAALASWAEAPSFLPRSWLRPAIPAMTIAVASAAAGWAAGLWGVVPLLAAGAVALTIGGALHRRISAVAAGATVAATDLVALAAVLERIEARTFGAPFLVDARCRLTDAPPASRAIRGLSRAVARLQLARNELVAPFAYATAWPALQAVAIERWRERHGARVKGWLAAAADVDAACAVAAHAFEHPVDPFPEIADGAGPTFEAEALGHPLLAEERCVRNDVRLGGNGPALLVVSGSNMSGKSTLLRAVGVNAVLALAGAPVRAARLRLSPVVVVASVRSRDSLLEGVSRFQAEVARLGAMLELARGGDPVLFLVDEILHGTNSADRLEGGSAVLRELEAAGAVGLCTTHDLALARVADEPGTRAMNVHFEDVLQDGRFSFDYRLRAGPVTRSNALALLRAAGLAV
jgi:hypothetical protein